MKPFFRCLRLERPTPLTLVLEKSSLGGLWGARVTFDRGAQRAWLEERRLLLRSRSEYPLGDVDMHLVQHWSASVQGQTIYSPPVVAIDRFPQFDMTITFGSSWGRYLCLGTFHEAHSRQTDFALFDQLREFIGRAPRRRAA